MDTNRGVSILQIKYFGQDIPCLQFITNGRNIQYLFKKMYFLNIIMSIIIERNYLRRSNTNSMFYFVI